MNKRIVLELDKKLDDNELLMYRNGQIVGVCIYTLLPAYLNALHDIETLKNDIAELKAQVRELRGEDDEESN